MHYFKGCDNKSIKSKYYESDAAEYYGNGNLTAATRMMEEELAESPELGSSWAKNLRARQNKDQFIDPECALERGY